MKRFSEQFKKRSESIRMRASERNALRERLVSYMEYHPLPKEMTQKAATSKAKTEALVSEPFFAVTFNKIYLRSFAGAFAMFFILSVPVLAERAVPGDMLYPVKVEFNEELRSSLAMSPYAKVAWETERLERRISEARLLASEGKFTDEAEAQVAEAVQSHTDAAQRGIAMMRETDSEEAAIAEIAFVSALTVQSEVLEGHIENDPGTEEGTRGRSVVALAETVARVRSSAEASQTNTTLSYGKLLGRVEQESTRVYEMFDTIKKEASPEDVTNVERRLADVERKIAAATALKEGTADSNADAEIGTMALKASSSLLQDIPEIPTTTDVTSSDLSLAATATEELSIPEIAEESEVITDPTEDTAEAESIELLKSALIDIQKLLNYLTHIDVRQNVTIEDLVPVTLTSEEKVAQIVTVIDEVERLKAELEGRELEPRLRSKVVHGQSEMERMITEATSALQRGNLEEAKNTSDEALAIVKDLIELTKDEPIKEEEGETRRGEQSTSTVETVE